jgi:DNA-binding beta-propeller fold protein YncE
MMQCWKAVVLIGVLVVPWGALAGCTASEAGVAPPIDQVFFPTGLAVDPAGDVLYVTNGNSDLRYSGGTLLALDLTKFRADLEAFSATGQVPAPVVGAASTTACRRNALVPYVLECQAQRYARWKNQTIMLGNFGGQIAVASLAATPGQGARLFIPVRGEPSLTWVDAGRRTDGSLELNCGNNGTLSRCGLGNRLTELETVTGIVPLGAEPYGLFADQGLGTLYVTSFASGPVSLFDIHEVAGGAPQYSDQLGNLFTASSMSQLGSVAVAPRPCRTENGLPVDALKPAGACDPAEQTEGTFLYVTSHYSDEIAVLTVRGAGGPCNPALGADDPCQQGVRDLRLISVNRVTLNATDPSNDNRGIAFAPDGTRLFVLDRAPPAMLVLDTSLEAGLPRNQIVDAIALEAEPSLIYAEQVGGRNRVFAVCFATSNAMVVDSDELRVVDTITLGQGPNAMAFSIAGQTRPLAFVANYVESDIAVIDLTPGSDTENQVIARIGYPAPVPLQ